MSLLYPLYALAALGIVAPILFHFFQRKPQGQRQFSSLLFLSATPPKVTSRSRLSDLLLLLCRALVLLLLAIAFARPFLRSASLLDVQAPSRSVVLLVDTSASMRRDGMWEDLQARLDEVIKDLRPVDEVALIRFDREPTLEVGFETWQNQAESGRIEWLRQQVKALEPTWQRTQFSAALTYASDLLLSQVAQQEDSEASRPLQLVLLSDLQEGGDLSALQSYQWPSEISVDLKTIEPKNRSNASVQWLPADVEERDNQKIRVLVRNESDSSAAQLELAWREKEAGAGTSPTFSTHVPPGQSRVVRLKQPVDAYRLELKGDEQVFDNSQFIPVTRPEEQELWFIGQESDNRDSLYFYLKQSPLDTRQRIVALKSISQSAALITMTADKVPLVIVESVLEKSAAALRRYVEAGGRVLVVLTADTNNPAMVSFLAELTGVGGVQIENVESDDESDYAMLSEVEFSNPLLRPFADARFNDFTKIRFWSHRSVNSSGDGEESWESVARFDDGSPALLETQHSNGGRVWVLTSGWQPKESQLALSTKFVPLLHGFFGSAEQATQGLARFEVGDAIPLRNPQATGGITVELPDGEVTKLAADATSFDDTDRPGIYEITEGNRAYKVAINLAKEESRTTPLMPGRFEQLGVKLGEQRTVEATETEQRQMRNKELEGRQKFWRWGVVGALCFIAGETWLSGRRTTNPTHKT